ncbi:SDR family NAD(P)-dependent oxidoreductase [Microbacterium aurantiacum]|uniref:SDR family NAD(P)-dependent oxidoreductase n=1 Tax=Microbacterium aurantiacum TaxID=162393 RepID=UPI003D74386C
MIELSTGTAIVTGGAGGIGAATALKLAEAGAHVVIADRANVGGETLAESLRKDGWAASYHLLDVTQESSWDELIEGIKALPPLRVLVNNAGIATWGNDVETETISGWDKMIAINQTGVWLGMRAVAAPMRAAGGGSIINLASVLATVGGYGEEIAYHASKGAVRSMTKSAAIHWATEGIRVNSVHPGYIATPMSLEGLDDWHESRILGNTPMGRMGTPEEVASVIAFLASAGSAYMTGSEIYVDGGYTAV